MTRAAAAGTLYSSALQKGHMGRRVAPGLRSWRKHLHERVTSQALGVTHQHATQEGADSVQMSLPQQSLRLRAG